MILSSLCLSACYGKIVSENYHALAHPNAVQCFSRLNSLDRARDKFLLLIDVRLSSSLDSILQLYRVTQIKVAFFRKCYSFFKSPYLQKKYSKNYPDLEI